MAARSCSVSSPTRSARDDHGTLAEALWDLVWSGRVSNDTFAPVRTLVGRGGAHRTTRPTPRAPHPRPACQVTPRRAAGPADRQRPLVHPRRDLRRPDEPAAGSHRVPGRALWRGDPRFGHGGADAGRVRRRLSRAARARADRSRACGATTSRRSGRPSSRRPATVDRMRGHVNDDDRPTDAAAVTLAATDPANPYGAALPWPERGEGSAGHRPARKAGSLVVLHDGRLVALSRAGRAQGAGVRRRSSPAGRRRCLAHRHGARQADQPADDRDRRRPARRLHAVRRSAARGGFERTIKGCGIDA